MKDGKEPPAAREEDGRRADRANALQGRQRTRRSSSRSSRDFQCPFCERVEPTVEADHEDLRRQGEVRLAPQAPPDAPGRAARLRGSRARRFKQKGTDGFWKMHDMLFENQSTPDGLKRAALEKLRRGARPRHGQVQGGARQPTPTRRAIDADDEGRRRRRHQRHARRSSINGYFMSGAQPFPKFKKLIDRALAEAK